MYLMLALSNRFIFLTIMVIVFCSKVNAASKLLAIYFVVSLKLEDVLMRF